MRGKLAMKANYWAAVLVALVLGAATRGQYGMTMRITPQNVDIDVDPESVKTFLMEHPELVLAAVVYFPLRCSYRCSLRFSCSTRCRWDAGTSISATVSGRAGWRIF